MNKDFKRHNGLVFFLLFLILVIGLLSYQNAQDYAKLKEVFDEEKKELESNLSNVINDYEDALSGNHHLSQKINEELQKLVKLRDTIQNLKESNYRLIRFYRKRIGELEENNKKLLTQIDSLYIQNNELQEENKGVKETLLEKESENDLLAKKNKYLRATKANLERKIASAVIIKTSAISAEAMKKRSAGKHVSTNRSSRTDAFKVYFNLLKNEIVDSGLVPIFIQVLDEEDKIISSKGITELKGGAKVSYSDAFLAEYFNEQISVVSLISVNRDSIKKGTYTVKVFVNEMYSGETQLSLR